jgi:hypothetical protein
LLINRTNFVDDQYGTAGGIPDDLANAYQTIPQGLAAALTLDTVYVQPGTYTITSSLVLQNNINWYFTEGAIIECSANVLFDDNGTNVNCSITGYGQFRMTGTGQSILRLSGSSNVVFEAQSVVGLSTGSLFDLSASTGTRTLTVRIPTISQPLIPSPISRFPVVSIASTGNVTLVSSSITSTMLAYIATGSIGSARFESTTIAAGSPASSSGDAIIAQALIANESDRYNVGLVAESIDFLSQTQALINRDAASPSNQSVVELTVLGTLTTAGGVAFASGAIGQNNRPQIVLEIASLRIAGTTAPASMTPFVSTGGLLTGSIEQLFSERASTTQHIIESRQGGVVSLTIDIYFGPSSPAFNVVGQNAIPFTQRLLVRGSRVNCAESLLDVVDEANVLVAFNRIECATTVVDRSAINIIGTVQVNTTLCVRVEATTLLLNRAGPGTPAPRGTIINHRAGVFFLDVQSYTTSATVNPNYNAILSASPNIGSTLKVNYFRFGAETGTPPGHDDSTFLRVEDNAGLTIDIGTILSRGLRTTAIECATVSARLVGEIDLLDFAPHDGNQSLVALVNVTGGSCDLAIQTILIGPGVTLAQNLDAISATSGFSRFEVGRITIEGGAGNTGSALRIADGAQTVVSIGTIEYVSPVFSTGTAIIASDTSDLSGSIQRVFGSGGGDGVHTSDSARVDLEIGYLQSGQNPLLHESTNQVTLVTTKMQSIGTNLACVVINVNTPTGAILTVGGIMESSLYANAIEYTGSQLIRLRVLSSVLLSTTASIFAPAGPTPDVTVAQAVAQRPVSNVNVFPVGALQDNTNVY